MGEARQLQVGRGFGQLQTSILLCREASALLRHFSTHLKDGGTCRGLQVSCSWCRANRQRASWVALTISRVVYGSELLWLMSIIGWSQANSQVCTNDSLGGKTRALPMAMKTPRLLSRSTAAPPPLPSSHREEGPRAQTFDDISARPILIFRWRAQ